MRTNTGKLTEEENIRISELQLKHPGDITPEEKEELERLEERRKNG